MQDVLRPGIGAPSVAKPPRLMGRFLCESLLHGEGMLETWRGRVQGLGGFDRVFAVKCLMAGALSRRPRAAEDLLRSARALASLKDSRIAAVVDSGLAPGSAFVVTEFIHGVSLRALREYVYGRATEEGGRPAAWPALLIYLCADVAGALAAAHGAGSPLVHGALATGSVMVTPQGGIKLVDLGLFASVHTPAEIAASPVRSPCAAPELSRGEAPTAAADMYALGALVFELATGRERHTASCGDSGPTFVSSRTDALAGPGWSRVLAAELQTLVRRLLSFEPAERPPASQAEAALREAISQVRGELAQLVRRVTQSSGAPPGHAAFGPGETPFAEGPVGDGGGLEDSFAPHEGAFHDEPTQVLVVSDDGNPTKLADILRDMREPQPGQDEEGTSIDGPRRRATPVFQTPRTGSPIFTSAGGYSIRGVTPAMDPAAKVHHPFLGARDADVETRVEGIPIVELPDVTTGEITLGLDAALAARARPQPAQVVAVARAQAPAPVAVEVARAETPAPPVPATIAVAQAQAPAPATVEVARVRSQALPAVEVATARHRVPRPVEMAPGVMPSAVFSTNPASRAPHLTPSGWRPTGDLEGPTETDNSPLLEEVLRDGRARRLYARPPSRWRRLILGTLVAAALAAGAMVTIRFVASRPPATIPAQHQPRTR
jgi:serine/threonine protein kinase